jgi:hypothetical protein
MYYTSTTNGPVWNPFGNVGNASNLKKDGTAFISREAKRGAYTPESNNTMTSSQECVLESVGSPKRVFLWERITSRH